MGYVQLNTGCLSCVSVDDIDIDAIQRTLEHHHKQQLAMCSTLEAIADDLPSIPDSQKVLVAAKTVYPLLKRAHQFEEEMLFPVFSKQESFCALLGRSLERLRFEHWEDESYAMEINDGLMSYMSDPANGNSDALGYMLRGFFEGVRRHIAFEVEHILPRLRTCGVTSTSYVRH